MSPGLVALLALSLLGGLISCSPILAATVSVAFLAGPHNLAEARYLLSRLPGRTGKLKPYFLTSMVGVVGLGLSSLVLPLFSGPLVLRSWNACLITWVACLALLRRNENPRREWPWVEPLALICIGLMWASPHGFTLLLVFGHPVLALLILGRELHAFRRPERHYYNQILAAVPVGLAVLVYGLSLRGWTQPSEIRSFFTYSGNTPLFLAAHAYLELLHYAVWIGALPLLAAVTRREKLSLFPVLKKDRRRLLAAKIMFLIGAFLAAVLWCGFYQNFEFTREVYFRVAVFHVLVEFPFLLRLF